MARARNIKPGFFKNETLAECTPLSRLLFAGLWCLADRDGRLEDRPKRIRAEVLPYDDGNVDSMLDELQRAGFILRYEADERRFIQVVNFCRHQNPHCKEPASTIPAPDEHHTSTVQEPDENRSSPADSLNLIPDSLNLIPEEPPLISPLEGGASSGPAASRPKPKRSSSGRATLTEWISTLKANGERPVSDYAAVWRYAKEVGLPQDWIEMAWLWFVERYARDEVGRRKRYTDWRGVFLRAVKGNWPKYWFWSETDGGYRLTTAGIQADIETREAAE